jgi:hypothetical protein
MTAPTGVHDKPEVAFWRALSLMLEEDKKPLQAVSDGRMTVVADDANARATAARYLGVAPASVALITFGVSRNPLQDFMLGLRSSQNHRRLGEVTLALYAYRYDPDLHDEARARLVRQLRHELEVGAWSCPGQEGHEAFGPSHAGHNLAADAAFRSYALETKDAELLALTEEHWRRLAEYLRLAMDDFGYVMTVGPRAWDATKAKAQGQPRSGRSAQLDAAARETWKPEMRFQDSRLQGLDMLGPRLVRKGLGIDFQPGGRLPVTVDPIVIRRTRPGAGPARAVLVYATTCTNLINPGPQMAALSAESGYFFAVDKRAGLDPAAGFTDAAADFKADDWWAYPLAETLEWRTPQTATSAPQKPEDPGPAQPPAPPEIGPQGLAGALHEAISRLRDIASRRAAARGEILAEAERLEAVATRVAALEAGK